MIGTRYVEPRFALPWRVPIEGGGGVVTVVQRGRWSRGEVRNVVIRRADGTLVARPARGMRRAP